MMYVVPPQYGWYDSASTMRDRSLSQHAGRDGKHQGTSAEATGVFAGPALIRGRRCVSDFV